MSDANFASLSSSLLARKGGAKPAMRPQSTLSGPVDGAAAAANLEDLGWNDLGEDEPNDAELNKSPLLKKPAQVVPISPDTDHENAAPNAVRESLDKIACQLGQNRDGTNNAKRKSALRQGKRAAFTLRLDHDRHLQLRLACTVRGCSAQQLVTDALDSLLASMPEIASLAAQVQRDNS